MKVLVLGSEGFIGSHIVKYFRSKGNKVTSADIVLKDEDQYILINPELPDFSVLFKSRDFDVCINATGAANVQLSFTYPALDYALNTANVYHILDNIRRYCPDCRFINLSSAAVYGNPASLPVSEQHPIQPLSPYGFHKWYSEQVCRQFYSLYGMKTISLRIFSAYGEGLKKQLFWDLHKKILSDNATLELFGTGKETRDFIYIDDIMSALNCIIHNTDFQGEAINVANGIELTVESVVEIFLQCLGSKTKVLFKGNNKVGDPLHWRADTGKLRSMGFEPTISIEQGLQKYADWVRQYR